MTQELYNIEFDYKSSYDQSCAELCIDPFKTVWLVRPHVQFAATSKGDKSVGVSGDGLVIHFFSGNQCRQT